MSFTRTLGAVGQLFDDYYIVTDKVTLKNQVGGKLGGREEITSAVSREILRKFRTENIRVVAGSTTNLMRTIAQLSNNDETMLRLRHFVIAGDDDTRLQYERLMDSLDIKPFIHTVGEDTGNVFCFITKEKRVERTMRTLLGSARESMEPFVTEPKIRKKIAKLDYVHIEGYLFFDGKVVEEVAEIGKESFVSLDCASFEVVKSNFDRLWDLLTQRKINLLFANEKEAKKITKQPAFREHFHLEEGKKLDPEAACRALRTFCDYVVITVGEKGCFYSGGDEAVNVSHCPANKVDGKVKDVTGAGDTFAGAFLWALSQDYPLDLVIQIATLAAGKIVRTIGSELPREEVESLKKEVSDLVRAVSETPHPAEEGKRRSLPAPPFPSDT